jgi:broad specificity phosphatase PhoE
MNNRYFLVRHGQSIRNITKVSSCWPETIKYPLTPKGRKDIARTAKKLKNKKIDLIFASDLLRTRQTAVIISKEIKVKVKTDSRLRDVNVGIFNNQPLNQVYRFWDKNDSLSLKQFYKKRFEIAPPKGEDYKQLEKRMESFVKEMERRYRNKNILVVSHQRPITFIEKVFHHYSREKTIDIVIKKREIETGELRIWK